MPASPGPLSPGPLSPNRQISITSVTSDLPCDTQKFLRFAGKKRRSYCERCLISVCFFVCYKLDVANGCMTSCVHEFSSLRSFAISFAWKMKAVNAKKICQHLRDLLEGSEFYRRSRLVVIFRTT